MDNLRVPAYGDINQPSKTFLRLLGDGQAELIQREGILLPVKYTIGKPGPVLCVGKSGIDIPAHADSGSLENLVECRSRGGVGLSQGRGRGCEKRGGGGRGEKVFHFWALCVVRGPNPF